MADPLSIAASIVGIATAGVQVSIKLYALAEKISTASQRVTTIANDVSSTCAILNQVRELMLPQPDAQGICKSVFNTNALSEISHAFRSCKSVFTEVEILLHRASEQVEKRSTTRSKIELTGFEKAKWPFLQPQFDDLRTELRDTKLNLMTMIAVATLALAKRDWRQRPMHERERLELGSTIVQFQRARTIKPRGQDSSLDTHSQRWSVRKLFGKRPNSVTNEHKVFREIQDPSDEQISGSRHLDATETFPPLPPSPPPPLQDVVSISPPSEQTRKASPHHSNLNLPDPSGATDDDGALALHAKADDSSSYGPSRGIPRTQDSESRELPALPGRQNVVSSQEKLAVEPESSLNNASSTPFITTKALESPPILTPPAMTPTASSPFHDRCHYQRWTTEYRQGLVTGHGNSVALCLMDLPERSLEKLVKTYTDEGHDPHKVMFELTVEQQRVMERSCLGHPKAEVVYVRLERNTTVPSVFGTLTIETLKWIVRSEVAWPRRGLSAAVSPGEMFFDGPEQRMNYLPLRRHVSTTESDQTVSVVTEQDMTEQQSVSWRTRVLRAMRYPKASQERLHVIYPKVSQEKVHVTPYREVHRSPRRYASRQSRATKRPSARVEIHSSPRPSACYVAVPSPKPLHIPTPQPVPMFIQPPLPPAPMPAPPAPPSHILSRHNHHGGAHYVEVPPRSSMSSRSSSPSRSEYVYTEREVRRERERNYKPEFSRRSSSPETSLRSRERLGDQEEDIVNELLAKWTT